MNLYDRQLTLFRTTYNRLEQISPVYSDVKRTWLRQHFPLAIYATYEIQISHYRHAKMEITISGDSLIPDFSRIEIIALDAYPTGCGMGTKLFEEAKHLLTELHLQKIYGIFLNDDAEKFYRAVGCDIRSKHFYFYGSQL